MNEFKFLPFLFLLTFGLFNQISAQNIINVSDIEKIYKLPIHQQESAILAKGFELGVIQPIVGQKQYDHYLYGKAVENISYITKTTKYGDEPGTISYQTWLPKHYGELSSQIANKYKFLKTNQFTDSDDSYDLYLGDGFKILVYSFISSGGKMIGNIIYKKM